MKCQRCNEHEATFRYTEVINGNKEEIFLCDKCAKDMKLDMNFNFGFDDIFSSLFANPVFTKPVEITDGLVCDACGMKYDDFAKNGMLGCENCYKVFNKRLDTVIKKLHGSNRHIEEVERPHSINSNSKNKSKSIANEIKELKEKLQTCIKSEDYEQAAIIRDKIKILEKSKDNIERGE